MGLFGRKKDAEVIKAEQVRRIRKNIERFTLDNKYGSTWEKRNEARQKLLGCIITLEELEGAESLNDEQLYLVLKHYTKYRNEEAMERIYPVQSRKYCEDMLGAIDWAEKTEYWLPYNIFYLIGGQTERSNPVVACPNLNETIACAAAWRLKYHGDDDDEAQMAAMFLFELVDMLQEAGYPGETIYWRDRLLWLEKHAENPAAAYLYLYMLDLSETRSNFERHEFEEKFSYYFEMLKSRKDSFSKHLKYFKRGR